MECKVNNTNENINSIKHYNRTILECKAIRQYPPIQEIFIRIVPEWNVKDENGIEISRFFKLESYQSGM